MPRVRQADRSRSAIEAHRTRLASRGAQCLRSPHSATSLVGARVSGNGVRTPLLLGRPLPPLSPLSHELRGGPEG